MPTQPELDDIARLLWCARMAEATGYVITPNKWLVKAKAMTDLLPNVFPTEELGKKYVDLYRIDAVKRHLSKEVESAWLKLEGRRLWVRLRLHATSNEAAVRKLKRAIPEGTEVELER